MGKFSLSVIGYFINDELRTYLNVSQLNVVYRLWSRKIPPYHSINIGHFCLLKMIRELRTFECHHGIDIATSVIENRWC